MKDQSIDMQNKSDWIYIKLGMLKTQKTDLKRLSASNAVKKCNSNMIVTYIDIKKIPAYIAWMDTRSVNSLVKF